MKAVKRVPRNRATGTDEIFVEALGLEPEVAAKIIYTNWKKNRQLKYVPREWATGILVLIYKRGDRMTPQAYRPITLLSNVGKVIGRAAVRIVNAQHRVNDCQLHLRHGTCAETAILRHLSNPRTMKWAAVLDLKPAYDMVPWERLHTVMKKRIDREKLIIVADMVQPLKIRTHGDDSGTRANIARSVR